MVLRGFMGLIKEGEWTFREKWLKTSMGSVFPSSFSFSSFFLGGEGKGGKDDFDEVGPFFFSISSLVCPVERVRGEEEEEDPPSFRITHHECN
jgi:hypothetical protein